MWILAWSMRRERRAPYSAGSRSWPWGHLNGFALRRCFRWQRKGPLTPAPLPRRAEGKTAQWEEYPLPLRERVAAKRPGEGVLSDGLAFFRGACNQRRAVGAHVR